MVGKAWISDREEMLGKEAGRHVQYKIAFGKEELAFQDTKNNVIFYATPQKPARIPDPVQLIRNSLEHPVGTEKLEDIVSENDRVALIIDDVTRPTPRKLILGQVLERLLAKGVPKKNIKIILALGTHRPMTQEEISGDLGTLAEEYEIVNISFMDKERFVRVGEMPDGTPIHIYRELMESDRIVGIGNIVPHIAAGWGGGAKIIMPGVCDKVTTEAVHMISCLEQNVLETCGNTDNKFRRTMEQLAEKVGLDFIVNTVIDEEKHVLGVFSGHFIAAHREGVEFAKKVLCPTVKERADILISSANPAHTDFWQAAKPFVFAHYAVKKGGVLIFVMDAAEGLCGCAPAHEKTIRRYFNKTEEEVRRAAASGEVDDALGLGEALIRIQTQGIVDVIVISHGLTDEDVKLLGFTRADTLEEAMSLARQKMGEDASVGIIPYGGEMLLRCGEG